MSTVLIIDDHPTMAFGTKLILSQMMGIEIVGVAYTGQDGLRLFEVHRPDIVILDLCLPDVNGIELAQTMKCLHPETHILIYSGEEAIENFIDPLLTAEVSAIIPKRVSHNQVIRTVESVLEGQSVLPTSLFHHLRLHPAEQNDAPFLTAKERQLLAMLVAGKTNQQIAETIFLSAKTVESHLTKVYKKLGVETRSQAAAKYQALNLHR